jgi:hemolysin-activating ACP:hemolysin acyltransferase
MLDDLKTILSLYRQFDRYNKNTDKELLFYILPSYELNQYKIHKQGEEVIAFTNWAFLDKDAEKQLILTARTTTTSMTNKTNDLRLLLFCSLPLALWALLSFGATVKINNF